jgi:hypothetical protein
VTNAPPILTTGNGEAFEVYGGYHKKVADKYFVIGERYTLVEHHERSSATHRHYFAVVAEGWANLPEHIAPQFPTSERLRKFALIKTGYHDSHSIVCSSKAEAQRIAAFIRPVDEFAVVVVEGATVTRYTAKSQGMKAMGAKAFQASKQAVLDYIDDMIGVERGATERAAA